MHDPLTVAFEIRNPFSRKKYPETLVTIWHRDPMEFKGKIGCRSDDSCGWFNPPFRADEMGLWRSRADYEYRSVYARQSRTAEGATYARVCYHPETTFDAVYWVWRSIRHEHLKGRYGYRTLWRYSAAPTPAEIEEIRLLASNPVDNLQNMQHAVKDTETFWQFYLCVLRAYRRFERPWYRHPRWHITHWEIQFHPWQKLRRWLFDRCAGCGGRFHRGETPTGGSWDYVKPRWFRSAKHLYHAGCMSHPRPDLRNSENPPEAA